MTEIQTSETQRAATPATILAWLREGNERFSSGESRQRDWSAQAAATADGQFPLAAVLGCIDSRVPVEAVLDAGIGDIFVSRTAGNVVGGDVLGGLEFAVAVAGVKVIVVLGHSACGAVKGACDGVEMGHLTGMLAKIRPAVEAASGGDPTPGSDDPDLVARAVEANVRHVTAAIGEQSEVLRDLHGAGKLAIVGAVYDLVSGRITWLGST